jgi:2-C-methyl-D-erythritol 4-phosphate cytidylyltransferase
MKRVTAIVLAAGKGLRFKSKIPKPLAQVNAKPLVIYALEVLGNHPDIAEIILVANQDNLKVIENKIRQHRIRKIDKIVLGGKRRQDSVRNALGFINPDRELVLIHDAVRPLINRQIVSRVIKEARKSKAAIVGVPVKATIKSVGRGLTVDKTLNRESLWEIQTPQVFSRELILEAYKKFGNMAVTDDASLVERLGRKVKMVMGSYANIKITTPEDLAIAQTIRNRI